MSPSSDPAIVALLATINQTNDLILQKNKKMGAWGTKAVKISSSEIPTTIFPQRISTKAWPSTNKGKARRFFL